MSPDFLVIGAGVAGLRAAIELASAGRVLVVVKDTLRESSSEYAQGGIAVALGDDDRVELHEEDTVAAGDGLCNLEAVRVLVEEGPAAIEQLIDWGAQFDHVDGELAFTREGAHSRNRILHAHGDSTGKEIAGTLYRRAASLPNIEFRSFSTTTDLLVEDGRVMGAAAYDARGHRSTAISARAVLLATGGLGCVFSETTNPEVATGDGVAMAWRVGAEISDIEFVQFHPTALHVDGAPRFLLSEALRGEGAFLRNAQGERFMERYHPLRELAPRDVVSRAIVAEIQRTGAPHVWLDITDRGADFLRARFPRIYDTCLRYGVDLAVAPAPVHPAAHYAMGGVRTNLDGRTSLDRLYAAGEVACTGVHGANRLASNSLLEGVVFGARAGRAMRECIAAPMMPLRLPLESEFPNVAVEEIRALAWKYCGIVRSGDGLQLAQQWLRSRPLGGPPKYELRNVHQIVSLIAECAIARQESRGAHFRTDFPEKSARFAEHSMVVRGAGPRFVRPTHSDRPK
jgi:L-aspartate oxidase